MFSEQGTSASKLAAAKLIDAVARAPGMTGQNSDVVGAYTQVNLEEEARRENIPGYVETWINLPKERQPPEWRSRFREPVVKLERNLYGHKLAGFFWERYVTRVLQSLGFVKAQD